jgi:hypothetical protein
VINEESPVSSPPRATSEKRRNPDSPGSKQAKKSRSELAKFYEATVEGRPINVNQGKLNNKVIFMFKPFFTV